VTAMGFITNQWVNRGQGIGLPAMQTEQTHVGTT
jgi:hypothetical protein